MFAPFAKGTRTGTGAAAEPGGGNAAADNSVDALKRQLDALQQKLDEISRGKEKG
jgi:hypothetical protein